MPEENLILKLTFEFSLEIIKYTEVLETLRKYNMSNQLFRAGTSVGAYVREAQGSESRADFIHKMKGAYKEANESSYWIELCNASESYPDPGPLPEMAERILKILGKIIATSHHNK
jgi:four helix bundle protein